MAPRRPNAGGLTARVWDIADELTAAAGRPAGRREVIDRVVAEGGNGNTASTQYADWKRAHAEATAGGAAGDAALPAPADEPRAAAKLNIGADGRVVIPVEMRRAMRLDPTGRVTARIVDGVLTLTSPSVGLQRAQALVAAFDTGTGSPVDELIRERRAAADE